MFRAYWCSRAPADLVWVKAAPVHQNCSFTCHVETFDGSSGDRNNRHEPLHSNSKAWYMLTLWTDLKQVLMFCDSYSSDSGPNCSNRWNETRQCRVTESKRSSAPQSPRVHLSCSSLILERNSQPFTVNTWAQKFCHYILLFVVVVVVFASVQLSLLTNVRFAINKIVIPVRQLVFVYTLTQMFKK